jgi:predicted nucleic acid-binding protein
VILVDTGPLVALFDPADPSHARCVRILESIEEPIATTIPVMTEAFHLLRSGSIGAQRLMDFVSEGGLLVAWLDDDTVLRAFELMLQYLDRPMDFADASLVVAAEKEKVRQVFTLDRDDFATYRVRRGHRHFALQVVS